MTELSGRYYQSGLMSKMTRKANHLLNDNEHSIVTDERDNEQMPWR